MNRIILIITLLAIDNIKAASQVNNSCIPDDWDGYWNSSIQQCYSDRLDFQLETLGYFLREQEFESLQESAIDICTNKSEEFGGEMAKHFYWDCFSASLQSEIDKSLAKASDNVRAFNSVDWQAVNHCKATYFSAAVETRIGSHLKGTEGWTELDFPKEVMNARCDIVAHDDRLIIYEGSKEWESGNHFFYVGVSDDFLITISAQPEVTSTHAQWTVTEFAELRTEADNTGCFTSKEIEICFNTGGQ